MMPPVRVHTMTTPVRPSPCIQGKHHGQDYSAYFPWRRCSSHDAKVLHGPGNSGLHGVEVGSMTGCAFMKKMNGELAYITFSPYDPEYTIK